MLLQQFLLTDKATNYSPARIEAWVEDYVGFLKELYKEEATKLTHTPNGIHCQMPRPSYQWLESRKCTLQKETIPVIVDLMFNQQPVLYWRSLDNGCAISFDNKALTEWESSIQLPRHVVMELGLGLNVETFKEKISLESYIYQKTGRKLVDGIWEKSN